MPPDTAECPRGGKTTVRTAVPSEPTSSADGELQGGKLEPGPGAPTTGSRHGAGADLTAGNKTRITAQLLQAEARFLASLRIPSFWTLALQ